MSPTVSLRAMTGAELAAFIASDLEAYARQRIESGEDPEVARRIAQQQGEEYLPGGRPAPGHELFVAEHSGRRVGIVWLGPQNAAPGDPSRAWIYDIEVDEAQRGRGYGRAILAAAETHALHRGVRDLGLNVFGHNEVARNLYRSAGYLERSVQMAKALAWGVRSGGAGSDRPTGGP